MSKRSCRDCPVPGCGAKYLVRLANHLADVHCLNINQRKNYLQEAKLQPKVKFIVYKTKSEENHNNNSAQDQERVYELVQSRRCQNQGKFLTRERNSETIFKSKKKDLSRKWLDF
jgi:hypothetical protein